MPNNGDMNNRGDKLRAYGWYAMILNSAKSAQYTIKLRPYGFVDIVKQKWNRFMLHRHSSPPAAHSSASFHSHLIIVLVRNVQQQLQQI